MKTTKLTIVEAPQKNVGKGLVGIASIDLDNLNLKSGSIVKLKSGDKISYSRVIRSQDAYEGKISMDGDIRSQLNTSIGDNIEIIPVEKIVDAKRISLSMLKHNDYDDSQLKAFNSQLKENQSLFYEKLLYNPITIGNTITIDTNRGRFSYKVNKITPKKSEVVLFEDNTQLDISDEIGESSGTGVYYEEGHWWDFLF